MRNNYMDQFLIRALMGYEDDGTEIRKCPVCGYQRQSETVAGNYEVCNQCLRPIHVHSRI